MLHFIILYMFCASLPRVRPQPQPRITMSPEPPKPLPPEWYNWLALWQQRHIISMTQEFLRDMTMKVKQADKVKESHQETMGYKLGSISAAIQQHFKTMLFSYRKYADMRSFITQEFPVGEVLVAFQQMHGIYNEIRLEKGFFRDVVLEASTATASQYTTPTHRHSTLGRRRAAKWRPNKRS